MKYVECRIVLNNINTLLYSLDDFSLVVSGGSGGAIIIPNKGVACFKG